MKKVVVHPHTRSLSVDVGLQNTPRTLSSKCRLCL